MYGTTYQPHREGLGIESLNMDMSVLVDQELKHERTVPAILSRVGPNFPIEVEHDVGQLCCGLSETGESDPRGVSAKKNEILDDMENIVQEEIVPEVSDEIRDQLEEDESVIVGEIEQLWMDLRSAEADAGWRMAGYSVNILDEEEYEYHQW